MSSRKDAQAFSAAVALAVHRSAVEVNENLLLAGAGLPLELPALRWKAFHQSSKEV